MSDRFASGRNSLAECDVCSFRYKLSQLKPVVVKGVETAIRACPTCWDKDHPQLHLGEFPVDDPQAIRNPRPDFTGYNESREQVVPIRGFHTSAILGYVIATSS